MIILVIPKVPPAGQRDRASILASRKAENGVQYTVPVQKGLRCLGSRGTTAPRITWDRCYGIQGIHASVAARSCITLYRGDSGSTAVRLLLGSDSRLTDGTRNLGTVLLRIAPKLPPCFPSFRGANTCGVFSPIYCGNIWFHLAWKSWMSPPDQNIDLRHPQSQHRMYFCSRHHRGMC